MSLKASPRAASSAHLTSNSKGKDEDSAALINVSEWAGMLDVMSELVTFHRIKFFYEVSALAMSYSTSNLATLEMNRVRKNESIAGVLAGRCAKLRSLDCWDVGTNRGRIVVLGREAGGWAGDEMGEELKVDCMCASGT